MKGVYVANYKITGLTTARTLMYFSASSSKVIEVLATRIANLTNEANEQMEVCWQKISTLGTPTATTVTPAKAEDGDQAATLTVKANVTGSEPTYSSGTELYYDGPSSLSGYDPNILPETRFYIPPSGNWGLRLLANVVSFDALVSTWLREIG